ncbi:response regulator [Nakamurella multipartita]|jgi:DNA-binding NarL/FixJ family response regulator|uniref:Two component transcriptional regulator, LuxR family n=1 Tax=Nakamurella multipartita (strain ATCC 700099 / DSM 44233 / CIP 104796 / JCM 9543 / NBRC 105858 / Y-104) TaxID=479431 RepID=C8X6Y7_NAKMY|nr:response regulator transcription factor [Nakamurella multipartita]ACV80885.1 two component transcriptional regulator, LuxR family [Nakamurella multipartita DSM 44233]
MIRILLVDDHPVVRLGLRALFDQEDDLTVVGEAGTPEEAVAAVRELQPDLVLMDLQLGRAGNGADVTQAIRSGPDAPPVLILTNYDTDGDIIRSIEAGASGYLLKGAPPDELLLAVRSAAAGESALAPPIASRLLERLRTPQTSLSPREIEVLERVAAGRSNGEIARELVITEQTVKSHLVHIYTKLGVSSRTAAVSLARERGILRS